MRLKNIPGSRETIEASPLVLSDHEALLEMPGKWNDFFGNGNPICLEIGMGKGQFILENAVRNPGINYIGVEKYSSVIVRALEKRSGYEGRNLIFVRMDAEEIASVFGEGEVSKIFLNFSDPWPKERHAKRRLTSELYWGRYDRILVPGGHVVMKTDNTGLFRFSLEEGDRCGWDTGRHTFDLYHSEYLEGNIPTEYEDKFRNLGQKICYMDAERKG
ncbi:MAG: tRNA (guanosine(46)-N7)-methyltransferase TrmB [Lachnospiraceae bacterium]|nr:tRNA (guanosine(46)-N7)-methyltransferase TrmB [Lachnospiraceae bacterium]